MHLSIDIYICLQSSLLDCLQKCSALDSCVGCAQNGQNCYICDNDTTRGDVVPASLQNSFLIWRDHIASLLCEIYLYFIALNYCFILLTLMKCNVS